jgi:hypothetical protein
MTEKTSQCTRILGVMLFPSAAVKQKAKEGLDRFGRGIACLSGRQGLYRPKKSLQFLI